MGLLTEGHPLSWEETKKYAQFIREHGIEQFIHTYNKLKDRRNDCLKWGDEVEYIMVRFDHENKKVQLVLKAHDILPTLMEPEHTNPDDCSSLWRPEYADYMIEGTPGQPYGHLPVHFNMVEANMRLRRQQGQELLGKDEYVLSTSNFPRNGCIDFTYPTHKTTPSTSASASLFFPDEVIYPEHPRFKTLTRNIRMRRQSKVAIHVPLFIDEKTPRPFVEDLSIYGDAGDAYKSEAVEDSIYLDAMGLGMGCCCLQVTFQAQSIDEARFLYDQLTPLTPIVLALTAASPIWRGYLADVDCRWNVLCAMVDDRTPEERGLEPLKNERFHIPKSRYSSVDCYISPDSAMYNDTEVIQDADCFHKLTENGIDPMLAQHVAHLFIRDTVSLFKEKIHLDDTQDTDHFENINSTNWQSMRFKPPPVNSNIGWRVEFRPSELQMTDFENAALVTFIVLLTRAIMTYNLNLLIPISNVDENMQSAQKRDAVRHEKFHFRKCLSTMKTPETPCMASVQKSFFQDNECEHRLMTINEIINGSNEFVGLLRIIQDYLSNLEVDADTRCTINQYLNLISKRAAGTLMTNAAWMRNIVTRHPAYKHDSVVSDEIAYDLLWKMTKISTGEEECPTVLPLENDFLSSKCCALTDEKIDENSFIQDECVLIDQSGLLNVFHTLTRANYNRLKHEARISLNSFNDPVIDHFQTLFMTTMKPINSMDAIIQIFSLDKHEKLLEEKSNKNQLIMDNLNNKHYLLCQQVISLLEYGLKERISLLCPLPSVTQLTKTVSFLSLFFLHLHT
ncbi:unnamed protein product [Adineta steineri]|uniref:Glutamate--cysteine ligase n=1 Tax=Adineta steineri TaxID=433720 RepID=A0A814RQB4_9BILA|nr:unnamed protein product [Adineta steineri]